MSVVVYIHKGDSFYLNDIFQITRKNNPNQTIILLGDSENKKYAGLFNLVFYDINDYMVYDLNYKHYSVNTIPYEKFCYERWIILNNFLKTNNYETIIYSDSDNAFFMNINELFTNPEIQKYSVLYIGNEEMIVPNVFVAKKYVYDTIANGIYSFFSQEDDTIEELIKTKEWYYNNVKHFSDMFVLRFILDNNMEYINKANIDSVNVYSKPSIHFDDLYIDGNYNNIKDNIVFKNNIPYINDKQVFNLHFQGVKAKQDASIFLKKISQKRKSLVFGV